MLRPLSIEGGSSNELLKYPFFIATSLALAESTGAKLPITEVELMQRWWAMGGLEQSTQDATQHRRNTLVKLAKLSANAPHTPLLIADLNPTPLEELKACGVLRDHQLGHSVTFCHDIYEEWALCQWLVPQGNDLGQVLKQVQEPLSLIRPTQLLGTYHLESPDSAESWHVLYRSSEDEELRSVWQRALLASCLHSTQSPLLLEKVKPYLFENDAVLLKKLLQILRTEEVVPNAVFLSDAFASALSATERVDAARLYAQPKILLWVRFLDWLMPLISEDTSLLIPELVNLFTIWQRKFSGESIRHCPQIGLFSQQWLATLETADSRTSFTQQPKPLGLSLDYGDQRDLEKQLRALFLSSAGDVGDLVKAYLAMPPAVHARPHEVRTEVIAQSATLIKYAPAEFVEFILGTYIEPFEPERSSSDFTVFDDYGIDDHHDFYPASPVRAPFLGLLNSAPTEGLRLIHGLCNHAVDYWRQSCLQHARRPLTPQPVALEFPWGKQEFWGTGQTYLWSRGVWGSQMVQSAMMALEQWAFERLEAGEPFERVFQLVLQDNHSVAALSIAVSLCLANVEHAPTHALPLITSARLWDWDIARSVQDSTGSQSNEFADWHRSIFYLDGVRRLNKMPHRKRSLRDLTPYFVFHPDEAVRDNYTSAVRQFPHSLPYDYDEQMGHSGYEETVREKVVLYAEQADPQYWQVQPLKDHDGHYVWNDPPTLKQDKYQAQRAQHAELDQSTGLAMWAERAFESGEVGSAYVWDTAIAHIQALITPDLFHDHGNDGDIHARMRASAAVSVAAALARFADDALLTAHQTWCLELLDQASAIVEAQDAITMRSSLLTLHPAVYAARGYSALLARGIETSHCKTQLLYLSMDAMEWVVDAVFSCADQYAHVEAEFHWILFASGVEQCIAPYGDLPDAYACYWSDAEAGRKLQLIERAQAHIANHTVPALPDIPAQWIFTGAPLEPPEQPKNRYRHHDTQGYARNWLAFLYHLPKHTLFHFDLDRLLQGEQRRAIIGLVQHILEEVIQHIEPPFADPSGDFSSNKPYEWIHQSSAWIGRVCTVVTHAEVDSVVLKRLADCSEGTRWEIQSEIMRTFMLEGLLGRARIEPYRLETWHALTAVVLEHPELTRGRADSYIGNEFLGCAYATLFCAELDMSRLICGADPGWSQLRSFESTVRTATVNFGEVDSLFYCVTTFYRAGGADFLPDPALSWLCEAVLGHKGETEFWQHNGDDTIALLEQLIEHKSSILSANHHVMITRMTDVLVDCGVRSAGFLQQALQRGL